MDNDPELGAFGYTNLDDLPTIGRFRAADGKDRSTLVPTVIVGIGTAGTTDDELSYWVTTPDGADRMADMLRAAAAKSRADHWET